MVLYVPKCIATIKNLHSIARIGEIEESSSEE